MSRTQASLARTARTLAITACLAGATPSLAGAASMSNSFGVPNNPQPPPGQGPGFPQPGFPPQPPGYNQPGMQPGMQPGYPPQNPNQRPPQQPFAGTPQPQPSPQPFPQPSPQPLPGQQQPVGIQQYLVSTWQGQTRDENGTLDIVVMFRPDSTFTQVMIFNNGQFQLAIMGRYTAQLGPESGVITLNPQQWNPRQVCNNGQCQPLNLPPSIPIPFKPVSRDQIQVEGGTLQRSGPPS